MPEWLNGADSKSVVRLGVPWVRIPPSPIINKLHLGAGRLGIKSDVRKAVAWYRAAVKHGDPVALQSLVVLKATHPEVMREESDVY